MRLRIGTIVLSLLTMGLLAAPGHALAEPPAPPERHGTASPDAVMAGLQRRLAWYQETRAVAQSIRGVLDIDPDRSEEQTAQRVLQRAFDTARARAAVLAQEDRAANPGQSSAPRLDRLGQIRTTIDQSEREIARLLAQLRTAPPGNRPALERGLAAARNRRDLARVQLDFVTKLAQVDASAAGEETDLSHQIQALQESVPELSGAGRAAGAPAAAPARVSAPTGAWTFVYRLITLQRNRSSLHELTRTTTALARDTGAEIQATQQEVRPVVTRLRALAEDPAGGGASLATGQDEFRTLLERVKLVGAVVLPLREESALLQRAVGDQQAWVRALDREMGQALRGLVLELLGLAIALGLILIGSVLWRVLVARYVQNVYHRRLLLTARHIVIVAAVALVLIFHFTSELTALVAALGFAAAGIAFALQTVILAVAGYFTMVAPNGVRVGDRVSLQGPFGYAHGEVMEIGIVRTRLRELAGEPLQPTGRLLVFPNSVMFTGSFIKHPTETGRAS